MSQSKSILDLNNLLARYEANGLEKSSSARYLISNLNPSKVNIDNNQSKESRYISATTLNEQNYLLSNSIPQNFSMSKSQCERFLLRIREQLKKQSKGLKFCSENCIKQILQNFQKQHQLIKRQILNLLEKAFKQNQKNIRNQLKRQGQIDPQQFIQCRKKIIDFDEMIERLLHDLKTSDYRKAIAEVVLKDFNNELFQLRESTIMAKDDYINNLGGTEINRQKIQCIKHDLNNLFTFSHASSNLFSNIFKDITKAYQPQTESFFRPQSQSKSKVNTYTFNNSIYEKKNNFNTVSQNNKNKQQSKKSFFNFFS